MAQEVSGMVMGHSEDLVLMEELRQMHEENGGVVLEDQEFIKYKDILEVLWAKRMFDETYPDLQSSSLTRYSTADF